jgi:hypothetical protein
MLDMSAAKPAKQIHQMFKDRMREEAEEYEEDMNEQAEWFAEWDEDDDRECYMDFDGE